ncbi:PRC-barrel domain-containing protein [Mameliella sediminis]|uniref:PRC-barrel domain-containing protein n=1 Tax=Mameliella sediminis TaxID=2836866 RepID=UPI001C480AB9|nr:PRC-barrel domain-containing protein [Mameliella sediminis]MBV7392767.1 PRC-barrel domain-containing protein [Mameliella sediminis]
MNRFMMTVAATALIPAAAFAESHATGDTMDPAADPVPMEQADPMAADPAAETDAPDMTDKDVAEDADPMTPKPVPSDMAKADGASQSGLMAPVKASVIIGAPIYTLSETGEAEWDASVRYEAVADEWTRIGSIDDFVVDESGKITGLVAEVGGFLGLGDTFVLLPLDEAKMVMVSETSYAVVTPFTGDQLADMERVQ